MRLGIFGGSFDPVHYGHLLLAECCREQLALDEVWFLPAEVAPHKRNAQRSAARHRVEMLRLAIGGHAPFRVSTLEIERGGISYTVDTLAQVRRQQPEAELFLLMGADSLEDLPTWREPATICRLSIPVAVRRRNARPPDFHRLAEWVDAERRERIAASQVDMPLIELSSREIRAAVAAGRSIRFRTPRAVERYIEQHGLYRAGHA